MTIFVLWSAETDAAFRSQYAAVTGETIQDTPLTDGSKFLAGSGRITSEQVGSLQAEFTDVLFSADYPSGFVPLLNS